jgi:transposase-like protein
LSFHEINRIRSRRPAPRLDAFEGGAWGQKFPTVVAAWRRGHFPSDDAAGKLIWLALRNITADWGQGGAQLERGDEPVRDPVCRAFHPRGLIDRSG